MAKFKMMGPVLDRLLPYSVKGITLAPFGIYFREGYKVPNEVYNEEKIHWEQQTEMAYLFFYLWYFLEWLIKWFKYRKDAYQNISFEREAKRKSLITCYYLRRKPFAWVYFINHKI